MFFSAAGWHPSHKRTREMEALVARLEVVAAKLEAQAGVAPPVADAAAAAVSPSPAGATPASVSSFDALIAGPLKKVTDLAAPLGPEVADATALFAKAFEAEAVVVSAIATCKKPDVGALQKLLLPVGELMMKVGEKAEGRRTDQFNHCKTLAEAVQALSFVAFQGPDMGMSMPVAHVSEAWQSAEFYSNKILMQYRASAPEHVEWVKAVKDLVDTSLKQYVKEHHTTGPAWNPKGGDVASWKPSAAGSAPKPAGGPPPPPPPPPPGALTAPRGGGPPPPPPPPPGSLNANGAAPAPAPAGGMNAVFKELNKGEAITSGLRKVTDDMKTKNRADRVGLVADAPKANGSSAKAAPAAPAAKPARFALDGKRWAIEHQVGNKSMVIEDVNPKQTVYAYDCVDCVITVKGKANNIVLDKCKKTALVFDDVLATAEMVNCASVQVQCTGTVPTVIADKVDGCQIFLGPASYGAEITTAKCSEVNVVCLPPEGSEEDAEETPVPEQFVTKRGADGKWHTVPLGHSGG